MVLALSIYLWNVPQANVALHTVICVYQLNLLSGWILVKYATGINGLMCKGLLSFRMFFFYCRLGESEGSYCTLATFPSETRFSSSSSENSTPTTTPPTTPLQDKFQFRKVQKPPHQRYSMDFPNRYRNHPHNVFLSSLRVKSSNDVSFC